MSQHQIWQDYQTSSFSSGYSGSFKVAFLAAMLSAQNIANAELAAVNAPSVWVVPPAEGGISGSFQSLKITRASLDVAIIELLKSVHETLAAQQVSLEPDAAKLLRRNLWQLYK